MTGLEGLAGSSFPDVLIGDTGANRLDGGPGDDLASGGEGNDLLLGRDGADRLFGEGADDVLEGGAGDDELGGGDGKDSLLAGEGTDVAFGDGGDDIIDGGAGADEQDGGAGDDSCPDGLNPPTCENTSIPIGASVICQVDLTVNSFAVTQDTDLTADEWHFDTFADVPDTAHVYYPLIQADSGDTVQLGLTISSGLYPKETFPKIPSIRTIVFETDLTNEDVGATSLSPGLLTCPGTLNAVVPVTKVITPGPWFFRFFPLPGAPPFVVFVVSVAYNWNAFEVALPPGAGGADW